MNAVAPRTYAWENLPPQITQRDQFLLWKYMPVDGKVKPTKEPRQPAAPTYKASDTNPAHWRPFAFTSKQFRDNQNCPWAPDGIGWALVKGGGFIGLDYDNCISGDGAILPKVQSILDRLDGYKERSPSGRGIRIIVAGSCPTLDHHGRHFEDEEAYSFGRYLTLTGHTLPGSTAPIRDMSQTVALIVAEIDAARLKKSEPKRHRHTGSTTTPPLADDEIVRLARIASNSGKFARLYDLGDTSAYGGDKSDADAALVGILRFYTQDPAQITRILWSSNLPREKWERADYLPRTIAHVLSSGGDRYQPPRRATLLGYEPKTEEAHPDADVAQGTDDQAPPLTPALQPNEKLPAQDITTLLDCLKREEYGDAHLLSAAYADRVVYDHASKMWYFWAGHWWQEDRTAQIHHLIGAGLASLYVMGAADLEREAGAKRAEADTTEDVVKAQALRAEAAKFAKAVDDFTKRARDLRRRQRMVNVLGLAQPFAAIAGDEWDSRPNLLAVANGVVDLTTGELHNGRPTDYLRRAAPTVWHGLDAPAPRWNQFLREMFRTAPEMPAFLQRLFGYAITASGVEHKLPILHGAQGRNGKDTMLETLNGVLGAGLADAVTADVLIGRKDRPGSADPHLMNLQGKRICWASETNEGARLNAGQVKLITGGGHITARPLYGRTISFKPTHLLLLLTNHLPEGAADDEALWARLLSIECRERFLEAPDPNNAHEHKRDANLLTTLRSEAPGILAWLVRGALAWHKEGLQPPEVVTTATKDYRGSQDVLGQFIKEVCEEDPEGITLASVLYDSYAAWAGKKLAMPARAFGERMKTRYTRTHTRNGSVYVGVKIRPMTSNQWPYESHEATF